MGQHRSAIAPGYDTDFFAWTQHQAKLLRLLNGLRSDLPEELDIDHVAEEIEDLGSAELNSVKSLIRQILAHLVKTASDPGAAAEAHWRSEAVTFQLDLLDRYAPSMRQRIDMHSIWRRAVRGAASQLRDHGSELLPDIPLRCPFSVDDIVIESFDFDAALEQLRKTPSPM